MYGLPRSGCPPPTHTQTRVDKAAKGDASKTCNRSLAETAEHSSGSERANLVAILCNDFPEISLLKKRHEKIKISMHTIILIKHAI